jgi:hypothetical protein
VSHAVLFKQLLHLYVVKFRTAIRLHHVGDALGKFFFNAAAIVDPLLSLTGTANAYRKNTSIQVSM